MLASALWGGGSLHPPQGRHMKPYLLLVSLMLVACGDPSYRRCPCAGDDGVHQCRPCDPIKPDAFPDAMLRETYAASLLGREIPTDSDYLKAAANAQEALSSGSYFHPYTWRSQETGISGIFKLLRLKGGGNKCVVYEESITLPVKTMTAQGLACRDPGGFWRLVSQSPLHRPYERVGP